MLSARLKAFDDAPFKAERQPRRSLSAPELSEPAADKMKTPDASSSTQPTPPEMGLHHRAGADEILAVSPSATSLPSYPDEWASARSVIGTAIEAEMMDEEEERETREVMFPLFRRMDFGGDGGAEGVAEDVYSIEELQARAVWQAQQQQRQQQQAKRKPSQRMSETFEAVAGFGRDVKRRVSSMFSRTDSNERKDSRWVNLETGKQEQVARRESTKLTKKKASSSEPTPSRWPTRKQASGQNNPYPYRNGFVGWRQQKPESRRTSAHWTPCSSGDAVSTEGIHNYELGDPVTPRSMIGATSDMGMASLTRQVTPPERHVQVTVTAVADEAINAQEKPSSGVRTPTKARPTGVSMVESGYALAHHLNHAISLGRFNSERIEQRFAGTEKEAKSPFDDDQDTAVESPATADLVFHSAESLSDETFQYMQSWFHDRSSRYPREPRPSASTVDQEPKASSSFGAHFAQIASVMGTSMQQAPVML